VSIQALVTILAEEGRALVVAAKAAKKVAAKRGRAREMIVSRESGLSPEKW
jgi:hypothetical protein